VAGFCEHVNDSPGSIKKAGYFLENLSDSFSIISCNLGE
jgi:hypothetical protein